MTTIQECDIRLVLGRLRHGSEYLWVGTANIGDDLSAIPEWRDASTTMPSEAEIIAEYDLILSEQTTANTQLDAIKTTAQSAVGVALVDLTAAQQKALLAALLFKAGGVDLSDATVKPLNQWVKQE